MSSTVPQTETPPTGPPGDGGRSRPRRRWLWFLAGLVLTLVVAEVAARQLGPRGTTRVVLEQHQTSLDREDGRTQTLVAGDSSIGAAVDAGLVADATGRSTYNLWLPNATVNTTSALLNDFAGITDETERVVIGLTPRMFNETTRPDRDRRLARLASSLPWESRSSPGLYTDLEQWASDRLAIVRFRTSLRRPSDWIVNLRSQGDLVLTDEGQVTFFSDLSVDEIRSDYEQGERAALADYEVSEIELDRLLDLIGSLQDRDVDVVILLLPTYDELYDQFLPGGAADRERFHTILAERLDGVAVTTIDATDLSAERGFFADGNHLNRAGSTALTERLIAGLTS